MLPVAGLQALLTVLLRANQIVSGLGLNILMLGATTLGYREIFGARSRDAIPGFERWSPPGFGQIPVFGEAVFTQNWMVHGAPLLFVAAALVLRFTGLGLAIHAAGEDPRPCSSCRPICSRFCRSPASSDDKQARAPCRRRSSREERLLSRRGQLGSGM